MNYSEITYDVQDNIATITLYRPDNLNAITKIMIEEIIDALNCADNDDNVRVIIFTGSGKAFCAGADLSIAGVATFDPKTYTDDIEHADDTKDMGGLISLRIFASLKPVIAAINGDAVGIGVTLTLAMDVRIAGDNARLGLIFARRGIVPEACSSWFLPRIIGISNAMELCATGRILSAHDARSVGLVSKVVKPEELIETARTLAKEIIINTAPVSVALTRQLLWGMLCADHPRKAHEIESLALNARGQQNDVKEGILSFFEKRKPNFPNKVSTDMPKMYPWWKDKN